MVNSFLVYWNLLKLELKKKIMEATVMKISVKEEQIIYYSETVKKQKFGWKSSSKV